MLTTTGSDLGAERPDDPLVYLCENEVVDSRSLAAEISRALALSHTAQEGPVFWGRTPAMTELRRQLEALARSPLPLLIEGETGTGKSFVAEHVIHPRSGVKGPLVVTDLSTVPPALLAAHLFGARRGAYTGAIEDHAGVFEQAHGGTLFVDEIGNLDLDLQRQLLAGARARAGHAARRHAAAAGGAAPGRRDQRRPGRGGPQRPVSSRPLHAAQPGHPAAAAAVARTARRPARAGALRVSRGAAVGGAAAAGARVSGPVSDAGPVRRRAQRSRVRAPAGCGRAARRVHRVHQPRGAGAPDRQRLAGKPAGAEAAGRQRRRVRADPAPRRARVSPKPRALPPCWTSPTR